MFEWMSPLNGGEGDVGLILIVSCFYRCCFVCCCCCCCCYCCYCFVLIGCGLLKCLNGCHLLTGERGKWA